MPPQQVQPADGDPAGSGISVRAGHCGIPRIQRFDADLSVVNAPASITWHSYLSTSAVCCWSVLRK